MSSKTAKPKEKDLYIPYKEALEGIFDQWYLDESYVTLETVLKKRQQVA
jgi:hypothetical protein